MLSVYQAPSVVGWIHLGANIKKNYYHINCSQTLTTDGSSSSFFTLFHPILSMRPYPQSMTKRTSPTSVSGSPKIAGPRQRRTTSLSGAAANPHALPIPADICCCVAWTQPFHSTVWTQLLLGLDCFHTSTIVCIERLTLSACTLLRLPLET